MERLFMLGLANALAASVLAVLVAVLARWLKERPAISHCLWLLVLMKLVTPPLFEVAVPRPGDQGDIEATQAVVAPMTIVGDMRIEVVEAAAAGSPTVMTCGPSPSLVIQSPEVEIPVDSGPTRLAKVMGLVWLIGTMGILALAMVRIARFQRVLALAEPADESLQGQVAKLAGAIGLRRPPRAWVIDAALTPMVWAAACEPRLILPRALWKGLDGRQRRLLLAHELAHIKRGDHLVRLFELTVTACFWWLPTVWWARQKLRDAEEQCCDAWVVWAFPDDARTYAETLLDTVDFLDHSRSGVPLLASGFSRAHHLSLRRRLTMIMMGKTPRRLSLTAALGAFGLGACLLPLTPTWAQKPGSTSTSQSVTIEVNDDENARGDQPATAEVRVHVVTDGEVEEVKTDSVSKAIEALNQRIEELVKKQGDGDQNKAQIDALKQAVKGLRNAHHGASTVVTARGGDATAKTETRQVTIVEGRPEIKADAKVKIGEETTTENRQVVILKAQADNPETRAKVAKAKARIAALQNDLQRKQKELAEAQKDLANLGGVDNQILMLNVDPNVKLEGELLLKKHPVEVKELRLQELKRGLASPRTGVFEVRSQSLSSKDQERLEALEKKLSKLLDEVDHIKKQNKSEK